jgi:hypothetical protein
MGRFKWRPIRTGATAAAVACMELPVNDNLLQELAQIMKSLDLSL